MPMAKINTMFTRPNVNCENYTYHTKITQYEMSCDIVKLYSSKTCLTSNDSKLMSGFRGHSTSPKLGRDLAPPKPMFIIHSSTCD